MPAPSKRRWRGPVALALAAVSGVATALLLWPHRDAPTDAPAERSTAERIATLARQAETIDPMSQPRELEACLTELTEAQPEDPTWWHRLAALQLGAKRHTDAVATYRRALDAPLSADEQNPLRLELAAELIEIGDLPAARREIERLRDFGVRQPQLDVCITRLLRLEGKPAEALEFLARSVPAERRDASVFLMLGLLEFDLEHYEAARERLTEAARLNPFGELAQFKLAECARLLGDAEGERKHRARYRSLHAARTEISILMQRLHRDGSLDAAEKGRLAESYAAVGQTSESEIWRQRAQSEGPVGERAGSSGVSPSDRDD